MTGTGSRQCPDFIDSYVHYTRGQETNEKIHRWTAISMIAAAMERKIWMNRGHYTLYPNLYIFIIGKSGLVRKSTSTGIGIDILRNLKDFRMMSERMTAASLIGQLQRSGCEFDYRGKKVRQSAVFAYASELKVFLGEVYGSTSELLTTFFDCTPHDASKPWIYETKGEGQVQIFGPCLNILGASTPTWLVNCIPANEMEGGFSSRVIFVVETDPPRKSIPFPELEEAESRLKNELMWDLERIHSLVGQVTISPEARKFYSEWYIKNQKLLVDQTDSRFNGYFGRKGDTILKLSMSCSVSEGDSLIIEERHIVRAVELLNSLEESMFEAFGAAGKNENSVELKAVWDLIRVRKKIKHSDILKVFWRDLTHRGLEEIAETLLRMGTIELGIVTGPNRDVVYRSKDSAHLELSS